MYLNDIDKEYDNLKKIMKKNDRIINEELLDRCYNLAKKCHQKQRRASGEPYIIHPVSVAKILATLGFETNIIAAALCHDILEDSEGENKVTYEDLIKITNIEVADLVNAVTSIKRDTDNLDLSKKSLDELSMRKFIEESQKHKFAYYIKLADRLHNLRTLDAMPRIKQLNKVTETRKLLLPIAKQLGANYFVVKLEDLCFKYDNREIYNQLYLNYINELKLRSNEIKKFESMLKKITNGNLNFQFPNLSSTFKSYIEYKRSIKNIYSSVTKNLTNIYHINISYTNDEIPLKNYILKVNLDNYTHPIKAFYKLYINYIHEQGYLWIAHGVDENDFRNHVLLQDRHKNTFRIYIITAEEGVKYNLGTIDKINFLGNKDEDFEEILDKKIAVYKRDGNKMEIQEGATVLDFAFHIQKDIGLCALGVILNDNILPFEQNNKQDEKLNPLYTILNEGDKVEIITDTSPNQPSHYHAQLDWLMYVKTKRAKRYLINYFKENLMLL